MSVKIEIQLTTNPAKTTKDWNDEEVWDGFVWVFMVGF